MRTPFTFEGLFRLMKKKLLQLRAQIDAVDKQLLVLLAERFRIIERVASHKAEHNLPARIPSRIKTVIDRREAAGRGLGLPRRSAAHIWELIVEESCRYEEWLMDQLHRDNKL